MTYDPEHSILAPSAAVRWTTCTASVPFLEENADRFPANTDSDASREGTLAHSVGEAILRGQPIPVGCDPDMVRHCTDYANFCRETITEDSDWHVELRVPLYYYPKQKGTMDFVCISPAGIAVRDLKYGYGEVDSEYNLQLSIYARSHIEQQLSNLLFVHPLWAKVNDDTPVSLGIFQPRLQGAPKVWTVTLGELRQFTDDKITPPAQSILKGDPGVFAPSDKACKFCPARKAGICEAHNAWLLDGLPDFEPLLKGKEVKPSAVAPEQVKELLDRAPKILKFFKDLGDYALEMTKAGKGEQFGRKLVASKGGHRYWSDEKAASLLLQKVLPYDQVWSQKIISPAQAEDLVKDKEVLDKLQTQVVKPAGGPTLAPLDDPRPTWGSETDDHFSDVQEVTWD